MAVNTNGLPISNTFPKYLEPHPFYAPIGVLSQLQIFLF